MNPVAYRAFEKLNQEDFSEIFSKLLGYTINRVNNMDWPNGIMPAGITPEDIAQRIIIKTLTGERHWNPDKVDLLRFMIGQVRSMISHLFERKEFLHEIHANDPDEDILEIVDSFIDDDEKKETQIFINPEVVLLKLEDDKERKEYVDGKLDNLLNAIIGKNELEEVFYAIEDGCKPEPRFLAERLEVPVSDINNRLKRLRRRAHPQKERRSEPHE